MLQHDSREALMSLTPMRVCVRQEEELEGRPGKGAERPAQERRGCLACLPCCSVM